MKFGEVIDALKNGLPIRRNAWDEGTYTYYDFDKYMFIDMFVSGNFYESQDAPFGLADLAADDWEIHEWDEETRLAELVNNLKWQFCWQCKCNEAVCPSCNCAICVSDCECDVPEWRKARDEVYSNNLRPKHPTSEEIQKRKDHLMQYRLDQIIIDIEKDEAFLKLIEKEVNDND